MKNTYSFLAVLFLVLCFASINFAQNQVIPEAINPKSQPLIIKESISMPGLQNNMSGQTNHLHKRAAKINNTLQNSQDGLKGIKIAAPVGMSLPNSLKKQNDYYLLSQVLEELWNGSAWGNNSKALITYNSDNTYAEWLFQAYNGSAWVDSSRTLYTYTNGKIATYTEQHFNGTMWLNDYKDSSSYDGNGNRTLEIIQLGDSLSWVNSIRFSHTYNVNNTLNSSLTEIWNGSAWVNSQQSIFTYDGNGNLTEEDVQVWSGSAWVTETIYTYSYNSDNKVVENIIQGWNGTSLQNYEKLDYTYDSNGKMSTEVLQTWDNTGMAWVNSNMDTYTYDSSGRQINDLNQTWFNNAWVNFAQYVDVFDANGNETEYDEQSWNGSGWTNTYVYTATYNSDNTYATELEQYYTGGVLSDEYGYSYTYDSNGNVATETDQVWNGSVLVNSYRYTYSYNLVTTGIAGNKNTPTKFELSQNYPNPFNPTTTINFSVPASSFVTIKVYDILGREIASLVNEQKAAGSYDVQFNGNNLSSGVYLYRMQAGSFVQTRKLMLMK
jgi:hypothetical protein